MTSRQIGYFARVPVAAEVPFSSSCTQASSSRGRKCRAVRHVHKHDSVLCRGFGKDTVEGWIDLSKLVSGSGGIKTAYEDLAYKIGMCSISKLSLFNICKCTSERLDW